MALIDNLISYWKMDEASGNAIDAHGSNDLTEVGTPNSVTGIISNARECTYAAGGEYFSIASNASLQFGDESFTIQMWINMASQALAGDLFAKWSASGFEYKLEYVDGADRFRFYVGDSAFTPVVANNYGAVPLSTWLCVHAWHDATANEIGISVNAGTPDTLSQSTGLPPAAQNSTLYVGQTISGPIDEIGLWRRCLTSDERTALYNGGAGLAYEDFDGGGVVDTGNGAVSLSFDASAISASDVIGSGAVSLSMTVVGGGKADATTAGAAAVSFSTQGVSQAEAISNGSALFSFDTIAIPFGGDVTDGATEFSFTSAAAGASDAIGRGAVSIGFSAAATGKADAAGAGLISLAFTADAVGKADAAGSSLVSLSFTALGITLVDIVSRGTASFSFSVQSAEAIALIPDRDFTVAFWSGIDSTVDFHNTDYDVIVDFKG